MIEAIRKLIVPVSRRSAPEEKSSVDAYNLWCEQYDSQPGNLMLDLDSQIFSHLLYGINLHNKHIADIGCGTGRHWPKLFSRVPASVTGFDVSPGMLGMLQAKFPDANTRVINDNLFSDIPDNSYEVIISTLTIAHIEQMEQALQSWCRILKQQSDMIITDFHPNALAFGGRRTFQYGKKSIAIKNYIHYVSEITSVLMQYGFRVVKMEEKRVDETVKHYYTAKNALQVYDKFHGSKIIYGMHLKRG